MMYINIVGGNGRRINSAAALRWSVAYTIAPLSQSERKDHFEDEQWVRPNVEDSETVSENLA